MTDDLFDELTQVIIVNIGPIGEALQETFDHIYSNAALAQRKNLALLVCKRSQHLGGVNTVKDNPSLTNRFIEANRDSGIGEL